jgi:hypothetical protein
MSSVSCWPDSGHLERAVETAGGQESFDDAVGAMLDGASSVRAGCIREPEPLAPHHHDQDVRRNGSGSPLHP